MMAAAHMASCQPQRWATVSARSSPSRRSVVAPRRAAAPSYAASPSAESPVAPAAPADVPQEAAASSTAATPPPGTSSAAAASLPAERLKQLRRDGMALKDSIKLGRRGVAEGLVTQLQLRWNTSEVAKLKCQGKHAVNMKLLVEQLEACTGGVVVQRAGGTVLLYRGDSWQPGQAALAAEQQQQEALQGGGHQQQEGDTAATAGAATAGAAGAGAEG